MIRALLIGLLLLPFAAQAAIEPLPFDSPGEEARFRSFLESVRCLVCQNQSLADSDAPLATDLRREIHGLMREGQSDTEIRTFLTSRYGDFVLYRPPLRRGTYALWFGPALVLLIGAVALVVIVRRRGRNAPLVPLSEDDD